MKARAPLPDELRPPAGRSRRAGDHGLGRAGPGGRRARRRHRPAPPGRRVRLGRSRRRCRARAPPGLRFALPVFGLTLVAISAWWGGLRPSNERDWQPEVAKLAYATTNGDFVTVHNIRNFDYRT